MERIGNYVINSYLKTIIRLHMSMTEDPLVKEVLYLINGTSHSYELLYHCWFATTLIQNTFLTPLKTINYIKYT